MRIVKSFRAAINGLGILIRTERNFQIHLGAFVLAISAGFYFHIKSEEFVYILLLSAMVFSLEGINTALEKLCNEVTEERKESIRVIKDISAGAVLIAAVFALVVAGIIFWKYLI